MDGRARILLLAHAPLAHALRACARHVLADAARGVLALDVAPDEEPSITLQRAHRLLRQGEYGSGPLPPTLILTDLPGATPCNVAQRLAAQLPCAALVTGVNLPMLLRAINYRHETLSALAHSATEGGQRAILQPQNMESTNT